MKILQCRYCGLIEKSYLLEDATFICEECKAKLEEHQKNVSTFIEEYCEINKDFEDINLEKEKIVN